jgi:hypothetical protein
MQSRQQHFLDLEEAILKLPKQIKRAYHPQTPFLRISEPKFKLPDPIFPFFGGLIASGALILYTAMNSALLFWLVPIPTILAIIYIFIYWINESRHRFVEFRNGNIRASSRKGRHFSGDPRFWKYHFKKANRFQLFLRQILVSFSELFEPKGIDTGEEITIRFHVNVFNYPYRLYAVAGSGQKIYLFDRLSLEQAESVKTTLEEAAEAFTEAPEK